MSREQRVEKETDVLQHSRSVLLWIQNGEATSWDPELLNLFAISAQQDIEAWQSPTNRRQRKTVTANTLALKRATTTAMDADDVPSPVSRNLRRARTGTAGSMQLHT